MKYIIDTNVPVKASCNPATCALDELDMVNACVEFIHALIKKIWIEKLFKNMNIM